jgi:hypothetical protein
MPRVTCPGCDEIIKVSNEEDRDVLRCPSCREKVYLREDEDREEDRPRERPLTKAGRRPRKRGPGPGKTDWLVTLAVIVPLLLLLLGLSPFFLMITVALTFVGFHVACLGIARSVMAYRALGLSLGEELPYFVRQMPIVMMYYQVRHLIDRPRILGLWFFLQWFGVAVMVTAAIITERVNPPLYPGEGAGHQQVVRPDDGQPKGGPPDSGPPVPSVTGDREIDRALMSLEDPIVSNRNWGATRLAQLPVNEQSRPVVAEKLAVLATSDNAFANGEAAQALAKWATPKEIPTLITCFRSVHQRSSAAEGLRKLGTAAEPAVRDLLSERQPDVRGAAIDLLGEIGSADSIPALRPLTEQGSFAHRAQAKKAIGAIRSRATK